MKAVDRLFFVKYNGIKWYIMVGCEFFLAAGRERHWYKMSCKYNAIVFFMEKIRHSGNLLHQENISLAGRFKY